MLTRPNSIVISSTRCAVNITRKYRVASSATIPKRFGTLSPRTFRPNRTAKNIITENARESEVNGTLSVMSDIRLDNSHAPYKREVLIYTISRVLCGAKAQRRYASKGIGGNCWAADVLNGDGPSNARIAPYLPLLL